MEAEKETVQDIEIHFVAFFFRDQTFYVGLIADFIYREDIFQNSNLIVNIGWTHLIPVYIETRPKMCCI